jgi:hypothetical protein|uniref:Uncharacterized protein n=3 Tax=root TaxID=1 RepID=A0A8S5UIA0_9CAUD|nr:MAG TPA: hypothetical protein [Myoviridae sp. ctu2j3]DAF94212.1 MAG TPA: hypothetical protein [Myoviridae sp. ctu2j3]
MRETRMQWEDDEMVTEHRPLDSIPIVPSIVEALKDFRHVVMARPSHNETVAKFPVRYAGVAPPTVPEAENTTHSK